MRKAITIRAAVLVGCCILFSSGYAQTDMKNYREQLNQYHEHHNEQYLKADSALKALPNQKSPSTLKVGGTPETYEFICQDMFLSGTNLAWGQFSGDVGFGANPDVSYFNTFFANVKAAGGNSIRWWLHTDAAFTPQIETSGNCTGLHHSMTNQQIIDQMEDVLDAAYANDIMVDICLFSFDMLQDATNKGWTDINSTGNKNFLTDADNVQSYIDNALTPMVNALKDHPALLCWEVFNEPEGMASEHGWTGNQGGQFVSMSDIQMVVNKVAGAIHRLDNENPVTNGCWSFIALSDIAPGSTQNYYRDDRLIAAGGDADGTLDFYQVHYYTWAGTALSPFHHDASYWGLDKPIMVAEFHAEETFGVAPEDLYDELFHRGYFGAWGWQYNETNLWNEIKPSMATLYADHASYIDFNIDYDCAGGVDCAGVTDGNAYYDDCGVCVGGTTGKEACTEDCNGEWGGTASIDDCGVCSGGTTGKTPNATCNCDITVSEEELCEAGEVTLTATGAVGLVQWFEAATGGDPIATGNTFTTTVTGNTIFYAKDAGEGTSTVSLGEQSQNTSALIWNIDDFSTGDKQIAITVEEEVTIAAVHVYPETNATNVVVRIMNGTTEVGSGTVTGASAVKTRVPLDITLQPGTYTMDAVGSTNRLEYQSELGTFPYVIDGLISFTGNASWAINEGRYGLFYDWEIVQQGGESTCSRTAGEVTINPSGAGCVNDDLDNDGVPNDEDCDPNDPNIGAATTWYQDLDNDGLGNSAVTQEACTQPTGYVDVAGDNNDNDADNDGIETGDDCDDTNETIGEATIWYEDLDGDGVGDVNNQMVSCTQPDDYVASSGDACPDDINKLQPQSCGCGVEEGTCDDCAGVPNGNAFEDACGTCAGGTTGVSPVTDPEECVATSLDDLNSSSIKIYPNPLEKTTTLLMEGAYDVKVYDLTGALIFEASFEDKLIMGDGWKSGVYLVEIVGKDTHVITRITKIK